MRKRILLAVLLCGVVLGVCACRDKADVDGEGDNKQEQEVVKSDEEIRNEVVTANPAAAIYNFSATPKVQRTLKGEDDQVYVSVFLKEPVVSAPERAFKDAKKKIEAVLKGQLDLYDSIATAMMDGYDISGDFKPVWKIETDYTVKRNDSKVLSILQQVYIDQGNGATFMNSALNFDAMTGDLIDQVFFTEGNAEEREAMEDLLNKKLTEKYPDSEISARTSFIDDALSGWYFTSDGIVVFYNAEIIAPATEGDFEITLSKDELPDFVKGYFIN